MASLSLPAPRHTAPASITRDNVATTATASLVATTSSTKPRHQPLNTKKKKKAPSYEVRCRTAAEASRLSKEQRKARGIKLFVPRSTADFDDGGAFPEIHVAQYPRHMGNPHLKKNTTKTTSKSGGTSGSMSSSGAQSTSRALVNVEVDEKGEVSYDAIVKGGTNANRIVYTKHEDMKGGDPQDVSLPSQEEENATASRTAAALQALIESKTALDKPSGSAMINADTSKNQEQKTQFIKYKADPKAPGYNPAAATRVIQMVPAQVDPMMPPKHKHLKAPPGPAEDPVPVLHAPPKKLTKEEKAAWNIPACISNWKNNRGYVIPLDKRLAADGRGLREHTINPNFATLSESLYVAEKQARQEVRMRAQVQKKLAMQEKEQREADLRELANQARMERSGMQQHQQQQQTKAGDEDDNKNPHVSDASSSEDDDDDREDTVAARQREKLRMERKREREREMRLANNMEAKRRRMEEERDVSEKIALGVHTGAGGGSDAVDSRLYNQSAGMDSGFGREDEYNTYSKPLFDRAGVSSSSIYRPTRGETAYNADEQYEKLLEGGKSFAPAKGFAGAQGGVGAGPRSGPVQFEKK